MNIEDIKIRGISCEKCNATPGILDDNFTFKIANNNKFVSRLINKYCSCDVGKRLEQSNKLLKLIESI